jgi:diaminopimelate epimerase
MQVTFSKYHGLGNDFILMDDPEGKIQRALTPETIRRLCHRNESIGADGILLRQTSRKGDHRMILYNADGSSAEISGNGLRCFVLFLQECGYVVDMELSIETQAGVMKAWLVAPEIVETTMPPPNFEPYHMPGQQAVSVKGETFMILPVNVGNPHGVIFGPPRDVSFARIYGPPLEKHELFPEGANIEFVHAESKTSCRLVVWERGAGITMACGSGSVATACAGAALGHFSFDVPIQVHQPGGILEITVGANFNSVRQRGPAKFVYNGRLKL